MALFNEKVIDQKEQLKEKERAKNTTVKKKKPISFSEKTIKEEPKTKAQPTVKPVKEQSKPNPKKAVKTNGKNKKISTDEIPQDVKKKKKGKFLSFFSKKKKDAPPVVKKKVAEIISIVDMTESGMFELKNEEYFEILQIESDDMYSKNEGEKQFIIYNHAYFYQAYQHAIKIVSLNFPCETGKQQLNIQRKINQCSNPLYERFLAQKLKELQFLEWGRTNREYYLFVYGKSESIVKDRVESAKRYLQRSTALLDVDEDKKLEIIFKLYNQNSKLGSRNL